MAEAIKYGFYTVNPDYLEYLNQIDSEVYYNPSYRTIVADSFKSAQTTAKWEMELSDIAQSKSSKKEFLEAIETEIKEVVSTYTK